MRRPIVSVRALGALLLVAVPAAVGGSQAWKNTAPESFRANAQIVGVGGGAGVAAVVGIKIDRYTSDADHDAIAKALKEQGYAAFVEALKQAPVIGAVTIGDRSVPIRWARQRPEGDGRHIAVVTEAPVFFAGGGAVDAKATAGYDVAVLEFTVDSVGLGKGTMAAAARVKPGGATGVTIEDYAGKPITLASVTRNLSQ
jgi:hypothetical protein